MAAQNVVTTNFVTVSSSKSVQNSILMNCVVNKIEDNLNYQLNIEQKSWKFMRNQEFLKGWKFHYKGKRNK